MQLCTDPELRIRLQFKLPDCLLLAIWSFGRLFSSFPTHDHLQRGQALGVQVSQDVAGVVLGGEEEQRGVAVVLDIMGQLDGFNLPFRFLVRAVLAATFPVPDRESYVRNRPLVVVVVAARVGAEGKGSCWLRFFFEVIAWVRRSSK